MKKISLQNVYALTAIFLGLWWVLTHWGFWDKGLYALGWNTAIFWTVLLTVLFKYSGLKLMQNLAWVFPIGLIITSFALWENPWLKTWSVLLLPLLLSIFYGQAKITAKAKTYWDAQILQTILDKMFSFVPALPSAVNQLGGTANQNLNKNTAEHLKQAGIGFGILVFLTFIIVPLLASVDEKFGALVETTFNFTSEAIDITLVGKVIVAALIAVVVMALFSSWNQTKTLEAGNTKTAPLSDSLTSVLFGGLLLIYGLFIFTQAETLLQGSLPTKFADTEKLVKSGFWQLFFISGINTVLFFVFYQRTSAFTQWLLRAFMLASTIILVSAAWRMVLYVTLYGLSYEKFFTLYTVLFSLVLFGYLMYSSFSNQRSNIVKNLCFGFLWCYSVATVLPVENIIFKANHQLAERPDSRIKLNELTMLSADVYSRTQAQYSLKKRSAETLTKTQHNKILGWKNWNNKIQRKIKDRAWYEYNLSLWINSRALKK